MDRVVYLAAHPDEADVVAALAEPLAAAGSRAARPSAAHLPAPNARALAG
ncbi:hypothetical protein [Actinoplanes sp. NPDC026619]